MTTSKSIPLREHWVCEYCGHVFAGVDPPHWCNHCGHEYFENLQDMQDEADESEKH